jgi:hypothetical protein
MVQVLTDSSKGEKGEGRFEQMRVHPAQELNEE